MASISDIAFGDTNQDTVLNAADVTMLRRYIAATNKADFVRDNPSFSEANADVNYDGRIDAADVTLLRRHLTATNPSTVPLGPVR
jgi:DNA polymerase II small subunit/DNA polymerase delta subunit B